MWGTPHPEEAVAGALWSQAALHARRQLDLEANTVVVVIVARLLPKDEDTPLVTKKMKQ